MDLDALKEKYESQSTEELVLLHTRKVLLEDANSVLESVLSSRGVSVNDVKNAEAIIDFEKNEVEGIKKLAKGYLFRALKRILILAVILVALAVYLVIRRDF